MRVKATRDEFKHLIETGLFLEPEKEELKLQEVTGENLKVYRGNFFLQVETGVSDVAALNQRQKRSPVEKGCSSTFMMNMPEAPNLEQELV